ncbi:MAG: urease accessory protein UreD [Candidatus Rokubacteria bacterium]|nr:urease accessory protein UreD [Candidatus Rokubacteria bacterium]
MGFERRGARTVVTRCRSTLPLQVLAPEALDDPAAVVSVLNPTGGLVGGDRLVIDVAVGPGAHACLTTPSATKVYRTDGEIAVQEVRLRVEAGATAEWVPDHTIPFAGSAFRQSIHAELGPGARLILVDAFAAGRIARGEAWRFARLESALNVRDTGGWLLHDRFALGGGEGWAALGFAEGAAYFATVAVVGELDPVALRAAVGRVVARDGGVRAAAGRLPRRGLLVRILAMDAPGLIDALDAVWGLARATLLDAPPLALRKP